MTALLLAIATLIAYRLGIATERRSTQGRVSFVSISPVRRANSRRRALRYSLLNRRGT